MAAPMLQGEITFFSEAKGDKIIFVANNRDVVEVGSDISCDIRIENASLLHMKIQLDTDTGKVTATNLSADAPIQVNGEVINDKKLLKSGDVITVLNHTMRWDSKEYLRRRTAALTKSARKEIKHRVVRTSKRITIHNLAASKLTNSSDDDEEQEEKQGEEEMELTPPQKEKDVSKISALNLSGTLITSFTPQKVNSPRSYSRTPLKNTPGNNAENSNGNAASPARISKSSMHLIDLTTPAPKRPRTPSAPASLPSSTTKRTPLSVKTPSRAATVVKNDTLLMSAIKNSSIKKRQNEPHKSATKGKALFTQTPILDESNASSAVVSVSFCSSTATTEEDEEKTIFNDEAQDDKSQTASSEQTSDEETKALLDKIASVIEQDEAIDAEKSQLTIEEKFQKIHADMSPERTAAFQGILSDTKTPEHVEEDFEEIANKPNDESHKKAETLLTWIETARESLASNNTEQVLSSRYSNVTPNDSIVATPTTYDAKTPKMSILEIRKSEVLAVSPVTRLSINDNSTVVVENYKLNSDIPKSLRSTRKRIGNAMASLHDTSQAADTTLGMNESMNASISTQKNDESALETTSNNLLSLDDQPQENVDDENAENIPPPAMNASNNYIAFAEHNNDDPDDDNEKEFFEVSNSDEAEDDKSSNNSESEEEQEKDNEMTPKATSSGCKPRLFSSVVKFRLSEQDLEEDGINPLDISSRTDDGADPADLSSQESLPPVQQGRDPDIPEEDVEIPATQQIVDDEEDIELPATQQIDENGGDDDDEDVELPATQQIDENGDEESYEHVELPATEQFSTQQLNDIIEGSGSVDIICHAQSDEVEALIEEHLESSATANDEQLDDEEILFTQHPVKEEEIIPCSQESAEPSSSGDEVVEIFSSSQGSEVSEKADVKGEEVAEVEISDDEPMTPVESVKGEEEADLTLTEVKEPEIPNSEDMFEDMDYDEAPNRVSSQLFDAPPETMAELPADLIEEDKCDELWEKVGTSENLEKTLSDEKIVENKSEEDLTQKEVPETPSRRRTTRVNYAELAAGSPAKTPRRGRSVSTDLEVSQTPKHAKSARKVVMEPIVEDSVALKISVSVEESPETFEIEVSSEVPPAVDSEPPSQEKPAESDENNDEKLESVVDENQGDEIEVIEPTLPEQDPVPEEIMPEQEDEHEFISLSPIKEQPCIKKVAYVTTNDEEVPTEAAQNEVIEKDEEVAQKSPEIAQKSPEIAAKIVNEEESSSRRRGPRINYADLAAGSPTKTPIHRRGRSASIEEPTPTPKRVKGPRKVMEAIDEFPIPTKAPSAASIELFTDEPEEEVFEKETPRRRNKIDYMAMSSGSSTKTLRRGRSASVDVQVLTQQKSKSPAKQSTITNNLLSTANNAGSVLMLDDIDATEREKKEQEIAQKLAPKKAVKNDEKTDNKDAKKPARKAKKAVVVDKDSEESEDEDPPKIIEPVVAKNPRGRKKAVEKVIESEESEEEAPEPAAKKQPRGRKAKAVEEEEPVPAKKSRTATKKVVSEPEKVIEKEPVKKGRRGAAKTPVEEEAKDSEPEEVEEPVKPSRGRRAAKVATEEEEKPAEKKVETVKKGRGKKLEEEVEEPEKVKEPVKKGRGRPAAKVDEPEKVKEPVKRGRGRAATKPSEDEIEIVESETEEEPVVVKKGRGRQAKTAVPTPQTSPAVSETKKVGRKQKEDETEASSSTVKGRRGGKTVAEEKVTKEVPAKKGRRGNLPQESSEEPQTKRTRRGGAKAVQEEIIEVTSSLEEEPRETPKKKTATKHVTIMTPASMEAKNRKESEAEAATKSTSRKRLAQVVEVSEEPVTKRATRAKKK